MVPVGVYSSLDEVFAYIRDTPFGQQASVFTSDPAALGPVLDVLSTAVGRINVNTQCGRSPDSVPFSGRRSSALGTMSVQEALRAFSVETVVAARSTEVDGRLLPAAEAHSNFLHPYI